MGDAGPEKPPLPAIESLQLDPPSLTLSNIRDGRRALVWGVAADGTKFDVTGDATFKTDSSNLTIDKEDYIYPHRRRGCFRYRQRGGQAGNASREGFRR